MFLSVSNLKQAGVKDPWGASSYVTADVAGTPLLSEVACQYDAYSRQMSTVQKIQLLCLSDSL